MVVIRNATPADISVIQDLAEKTWWKVYTPILEEEQITYMLDTIYSEDVLKQSMDDGSQVFLLLLEDEVAKGFVSFGPWKESPGIWKIHKLYVLPDCQGRGSGRNLVDEVCSRASHANVPSVVLNVNRYNPALNFYLRYGFSILRQEDIPIGKYWMNDYVMRIDL